jgi:hypothetical protein
MGGDCTRCLSSFIGEGKKLPLILRGFCDMLTTEVVAREEKYVRGFDMVLSPIRYDNLNPRQKEAYNFQKVSGLLADFGFITIRLTDDWQGADFIAQHINGREFLKVQLKGRCSLAKKYSGKNVHICFPDRGAWYLVPHDELVEWHRERNLVINTPSWEKGEYNFPLLSKSLSRHIENYRISPRDSSLLTEGYLGQRAKQGSKKAFLAALRHVPDVEPDPQDKLWAIS